MYIQIIKFDSWVPYVMFSIKIFSKTILTGNYTVREALMKNRMRLGEMFIII